MLLSCGCGIALAPCAKRLVDMNPHSLQEPQRAGTIRAVVQNQRTARARRESIAAVPGAPMPLRLKQDAYSVIFTVYDFASPPQRRRSMRSNAASDEPGWGHAASSRVREEAPRGSSMLDPIARFSKAEQSLLRPRPFAASARVTAAALGLYWRIVSFFGIHHNSHRVVIETCDSCRARSGMAGSASVVGGLAGGL